MSKIYETGLIVGRFQHIHLGHEKIINIGNTLCDKLLILINENKNKDENNPYSYNKRKELIEKIYRREIQNNEIILKKLEIPDFIHIPSIEWGKYVIKLSNNVLKKNVQCIIYGKDKNIFNCFNKETVENISEVIVDRKFLNASGTKLRQYLKKDNKEEWKKYVNEAIYEEYDNLRSLINKNIV